MIERTRGSDLRARSPNARWPDQVPGVAWEQDTDLQYLRQVLAYWVDELDRRTPEHELDAFARFRAELDGVRIQFIPYLW